MNMVRKFGWVLLLLLLAAALSSCGTQTSMTGVWKDPTYTGAPGQTVVVLALTGNERNVNIWQDGMSQALNGTGVKVILGSTILPVGPGAPPIDSMTAVQKIRDSGANLVMVSRLLSVNQVQTYVPGTVGYAPYGYYGYYAGGMAVVGTPGYYETDTQYELETNVFDVAQSKLVWSGASQTVDPSTASDMVNSVSNAIVNSLVSTGVITLPKKK
jgi:hypothetical protein